jgi:hypothetical protein
MDGNSSPGDARPGMGARRGGAEYRRRDIQLRLAMGMPVLKKW